MKLLTSALMTAFCLFGSETLLAQVTIYNDFSPNGDLTGTDVTQTVRQLHEAVTTITSVSSPYTVLSTDSVILCNAVTAAVTINLPATSGTNREILIKKTDTSTNICTVTPSGTDKVELAPTWPLLVPGSSVRIKDTSTGVWNILAMYPLEIFNSLNTHANGRLWVLEATGLANRLCLTRLNDNGTNSQTDCNLKMINVVTGGAVSKVSEIDLNVYDASNNATSITLQNSADMLMTSILTTAPFDVHYTNNETLCTDTSYGCGIRFELQDNVRQHGTIGQSSHFMTNPVMTGSYAASGDQFYITTFPTPDDSTIDIGPNKVSMLSMSSDGNSEKLQAGATPKTFLQGVNDGSGNVTTTLGSTNGTSVATVTGPAPTIVSGFGTGASISSNAGCYSFTVNVGTGGTASTGVVGCPTVTNGWVCSVHDTTTPASNFTDQTAFGASSVTLTNFVRTTGVTGAWPASDSVQVSCLPH